MCPERDSNGLQDINMLDLWMEVQIQKCTGKKVGLFRIIFIGMYLKQIGFKIPSHWANKLD